MKILCQGCCLRKGNQERYPTKVYRPFEAVGGKPELSV